MDWPGFVASFAGEPQQPVEYPFGVLKMAVSPQVEASMDSGVQRFETWCSAHGGRGGRAEFLAPSNAAVERFLKVMTAKLNADQARGSAWTPSIASACVDTASGEVIATMLSIRGYKHDAFERDGKHFEKVTRVFFDGRQTDRFVEAYTRREEERVARVVADSQARQAARAEATIRLRRQPHVGDRTTLGVVVEIRPPLALVQYDRRYREISGRPVSEWVPIESLSAPSE